MIFMTVMILRVSSDPCSSFHFMRNVILKYISNKHVTRHDFHAKRKILFTTIPFGNKAFIQKTLGDSLL